MLCWQTRMQAREHHCCSLAALSLVSTLVAGVITDQLMTNKLTCKHAAGSCPISYSIRVTSITPACSTQEAVLIALLGWLQATTPHQATLCITEHDAVILASRVLLLKMAAAECCAAMLESPASTTAQLLRTLQPCPFIG
jgi:hypothetical protein